MSFCGDEQKVSGLSPGTGKSSLAGDIGAWSAKKSNEGADKPRGASKKATTEVVARKCMIAGVEEDWVVILSYETGDNARQVAYSANMQINRCQIQRYIKRHKQSKVKSDNEEGRCRCTTARIHRLPMTREIR